MRRRRRAHIVNSVLALIAGALLGVVLRGVWPAASEARVPAAPAASRPRGYTPRAIAPSLAVAPVEVAGPDANLHPRKSGDWDGMRVDLSRRPPCETSLHCSFAKACIDGACGPCTADEQCAGGERCVLDHCVPAANASCRSRTDCGADEMCVLSGYSDGARHNADMRAYCLGPRSGVEPADEAAAAAADPVDVQPDAALSPAQRALVDRRQRALDLYEQIAIDGE